jgi:hypothetical protein
MEMPEHVQRLVATAPEPTTRTAPPSPAPASGGQSARTDWHRVQVATTDSYGEVLTRTVEGDDAWVAASLRALADRLDPPKPSRPGLREAVQGTRPTLRSPGGMVAPPPTYGMRRADPMSTS